MDLQRTMTLATGMLYFNTTDGEMRVYDGANWIAASASGSVSFTKYKYVATANQTTFSGTDANSATLSYLTNNIIVALNGVILDATDFTATNGTSVVLGSGAAVSDEVTIYAFKSFTVADAVAASTGGTFGGNVVFSGTTTGLDLNGTELILDSDGDTSITADTDDQIDFKVGGTDVATFTNSSSTFSGTTTINTFLELKTYDDQANKWVLFTDTNDALSFNYNGAGNAEVIIDTSGNLLVGTTLTGRGSGSSGASGINLNASGAVEIARSDNPVLFVNRTTSDGSIIDLRKDGTSVGSISTANGDLNIGTGDTGLQFRNGDNAIRPHNIDGVANRDDAIDLGTASVRFDDIHATNGTIQTSDQNEKQDIASATAKELNVAKKLSALFKTFKWKDKVTEKGDKARTHTGIIAQEVQSAFSAEGLDASKYGLFCSATWWEKDKEIYDTKEEAPEDSEERTRIGVRYPELFSFIFSSIEARLTALEAK